MTGLRLPVTFKDVEEEFPLTVAPGTFGTRYIVDVNGVEVVYEHDDSGELRAMIRDQSRLEKALPEGALLEAIGDVLKKVLS